MKKNIFDRYKNNYLSSKFIFIMDVLLSTFASTFTVLCLYALVHSPEITWQFVVSFISLAFCVSFVCEGVTGVHHYAIRHTSLSDIMRYLLGGIVKESIIVIAWACAGIFSVKMLFFIFIDFFVTVFFLICCRLFMVFVYRTYLEFENREMKRDNILIYGVRSKAASLVTRLSNSASYKVYGLLSSVPADNGKIIMDKKVYYFDEYRDFLNFVKSRDIKGVLFAHETDARAENEGIVRICFQNGIKVLIAPSVDEIKGEGRMMKGNIRELRIEDLLGRDEITLNLDEIQRNFNGKVIMVTGAAGSIGSELVRQIAPFGVKRVILFDNAETPMHNLKLELEENFPELDFVPIIGDIRFSSRLDYALRTYHPQIVFHAAAYKHVPMMEENPCEAVTVNVAGSRNVVDKCLEYNVEKMVMVSTDKAVNPTNVMGCSKRLAEMYVQAAGSALEKGLLNGNTKFITTRFGNVLGSSGSVIPLFYRQIQRGGPITVTHPDINRFFMTIPEACRLVMEAALLPQSNKIFVFDMGKPVKIDTLARKMAVLSGLEPDKDIKIVYTGLRPGEKLFEEVLSDAENTEPTSHERIKIAKVRECDYETVRRDNLKLENLASNCTDVDTLVKLMKTLVPEFKSNNSRFSQLDS